MPRYAERMQVLSRFWVRLAVVTLTAVISIGPAAANAQSVPSYARPNTEQTIHGRIRSIDGTFAISVDDDNGYIDSVQLHQGTIINPTGLTLAAGMSVTILGFNAGSVFQANEIDTPYHYGGQRPVPIYYGPGWWYPGYAYGWGPSFSLVIGIGGVARVERAPFVHVRPVTVAPGPRPYVGRPYVGRAGDGNRDHADRADHSDHGRDRR